MHVISLIDHVSPEEYWFSGVTVRAAAQSPDAPLTISCSFLNDRGRLAIEGTYRYARSSTSHKFSVSFGQDLARSTALRVNSGHTGELAGQFYPVVGGFLALVSGPSGNALSCQVELLKDSALRTTGAVRIGLHEFSFSATGSPDPDLAGLGNVVRVSGGKRA